MCAAVSNLLEHVRSVDPEAAEFHQAAEEVLESVVPIVNAHEEYRAANVLERLLEPDRTLRFRVTWEADDGSVHVHRGWRVQHTNALGPYKGGLRFHPTVNASVLKFLAFEQTFKNALSGLPLGAGKGGSDFDPRGRSDREVMRFCQSFMTELWHRIGPETDVPAGDIGVGSREVDFLFGQYKRLAGRWVGALTGKANELGGIRLRTEATGHGLVFFARAMLRHGRNDSLEGKRALVSGAGSVALHAAQKLIQCGAKVVTLSDSGGTLRIPEGLSDAALERVIEIKVTQRGSLADAVDAVDGSEFEAGSKPWAEESELAFPCATENELDEDGARALIGNGVQLVAEGANMPCTSAASRLLRAEGVLFGPGKAANAGGVAVSGLEMAQNADKRVWSRERVADELEAIMEGIHATCVAESRSENEDVVDYVRCANVAGFRRVADALVASGIG